MSTNTVKPAYRQLLLATLFATLIALPLDVLWKWSISAVSMAWYCWLPIMVVYIWVNLKILQTAYAKWAGTEVATHAIVWNYIAAAILAAIFSFLTAWSLDVMVNWDASSAKPRIFHWALQSVLMIPILAKLIKFEGRQQPATRPLAEYWRPFYTRGGKQSDADGVDVQDAPPDPSEQD